MDAIINTLSDYYFFIILIIVLLSLYLYDKYWCKAIGQLYYPNAFSYGYSGSNGPCLWKDVFPAASGERQSPINIVHSCAICVPSETVSPLSFSPEFHCVPSEMKLHNDGNNVVLCAQYACQKRPHLSGGPLDGNYRFAHARFRWGPNDNEGSEHMLNCTRYAMELQAAFVKTSMKRDDVLEAARCGWLVILSYVFMLARIIRRRGKPVWMHGINIRTEMPDLAAKILPIFKNLKRIIRPAFSPTGTLLNRFWDQYLRRNFSRAANNDNIEVTPTENPYLEPIVKSLSCLKCPCSYVCIEPIILSLLMPEFCRDYYYYIGSLSYPPCTEGVRWIIKPEPLMVSSAQLQKFRKLHAVSGLMDNNTRPVQMVNNRDVMYYD